MKLGLFILMVAFEKLGILFLTVLAVFLAILLIIFAIELFRIEKVVLFSRFYSLKEFITNKEYLPKNKILKKQQADYFRENENRINDKCGIIIFEAKIKKFTKFGQPEVIRPGTYHFLPDQVVYFSGENQNMKGNSRMVGVHRTGSVKSCQIKDSDLAYFRIKIIELPSPALFEWLEKYNIGYFYNSKDAYNLVLKLLINNPKYYRVATSDVEFNSEIEADRELERAKKILLEFQNDIRRKDFARIKENYLKFPVKLYETNDNILFKDKPFRMVDETTFDNLSSIIFSDSVIGEILSYDPDTICPCNHFMFISIFKIQFSKHHFTIRSIDVSLKVSDSEFQKEIACNLGSISHKRQI